MMVRSEVLTEVRFWISGQIAKFLNPDKNSQFYLPNFFLQLEKKVLFKS